MKDIKNILICGLGAIGTIYAEAIQKYSSANLKILVDETRLDRYTKNPVNFNGKTLKFNYILPCENDFKADLIIISTKYSGLKDAIKNIKNFVKSDTIIMSLLNGVTSEDIISKVYGAEKLVYSYFVGHSSVRKDRNVFHDGVNTLVFGTYENESNVNILKEFFDKIGINYEIPKDIKYSIWLKYMLNVSSNQTSAILNYTFGEIVNNPNCMNFINNIMKEVQSVAKAEGVKNTENMINEALEILYTMSPEGKTSMLQDIEAKRKTEVDIFAGEMVKLGQKHNIPTTYNIVIKDLINCISYYNI